MILTAVLATVALSSAVVSAQNEGGVHLALHPVPRRTDVHPLVLFQQHLNHASARHAKMSGGMYSRELAHDHIQKRIVKVGGAKTLSMSVEDMAEKMKNLKREIIEGSLVARAGTASSAPAAAAPSAAAPSGAAAPAGAAPAGGSKGPNAGGGAAGFSKDALKAAQGGGVLKSTAPDAENSLGYDIEAADVGYLSTISIGTPPKPLVFLMDSGSADTWGPSQACTVCGTHNTIGSTASSTFKATTSKFQVTYGSGAVAGMIGMDLMTIGSASMMRPIGVALQESVQFSGKGVPFDGLVGLAQSGLSEQKVPTPPEAFAKAGKLPSAAMSYALGRVADGTNTGQITFGGRDPARSDPASLVTVNVVATTGFWEVAMDDMTVNGKTLAFKGRTAILDTGTTLMLLPPADAAAVHAQIPGSKSDGQGGFTIPCTTTAVVSMTIGGKAYDIDPRDTTFLPVDDAKPTGDCISGIGAGQIGTAQQFLIGDVFLKNVYMTTDVATNTVTLSKAVVPQGLQPAAAGGAAPAAAPAAGGNATAPAAAPAAAAASGSSTTSAGKRRISFGRDW